VGFHHPGRTDEPRPDDIKKLMSQGGQLRRIHRFRPDFPYYRIVGGESLRCRNRAASKKKEGVKAQSPIH
jgi:hypothetical protein